MTFTRKERRRHKLRQKSRQKSRQVKTNDYRKVAAEIPQEMDQKPCGKPDFSRPQMYEETKITMQKFDFWMGSIIMEPS